MEKRRWSDEAFNDFWSAYPRKVGKFAAKREWDKLRPSPELVKAMADALRWQVPLWSDPAYIPHPRTWLHQGRWMDEPTEPKAAVKVKAVGGAAEMVMRLTGNEDLLR